MRDRLASLGMRRPPRIKEDDFQVPMLCEADFETEVLQSRVTWLHMTQCAPTPQTTASVGT